MADLTRRLTFSVLSGTLVLLPILACNNQPFGPTDPHATLGEDQEWRGVVLIRSPAFQNSDIVDRIISESRAFNSRSDTLPCIWWRRPLVGEDGANCSWQVVRVFADTIRLNTYLHDSNTVAAILPAAPKTWDITLVVDGYRSTLGPVRSYGFSAARDGPALAANTVDWPGNGAGRVLARTGLDVNHGILRYLDLRTGDYRDFDLGWVAWTPMAPGLTWDPQMVWFATSTASPATHYWRLVPTLARVDTLFSPCQIWFRFAVAVSPTECVAVGKSYSVFVTDSSTNFPNAGEPSRVKYSVSARRWLTLWSSGRDVWDFGGRVAYHVDGFTSFEAAAFSPTGDTLFVAVHPKELLVLNSHTGERYATRRLHDSPYNDIEGTIDDLLADPSSRWLYMMRGCHQPRLEILDRFTLEMVRRIDLPSEDREFSCSYGSLILSRFWENALYFIMSDGDREFSRERSRIFRFEIPAPTSGGR